MTSDEMFQKYLEEENRPKIEKLTIFQKIRNYIMHKRFLKLHTPKCDWVESNKKEL